MFSAEQETFRREIRDFLEYEIRQGTFVPQCDAWVLGFNLEFSRKLAEKGWIGLTFPKEYGGQQRGYLDRLILTEELLRYGAPCGAHWLSDRQIGPCILAYGSEELKCEFLPRITRAEVLFGIGMSEPEAGSDLASLKTRAMETDDEYIIDGQKVWTSGAHHFTHCYLIARTDQDVPKHKGLSEFLVDIKTPGITIKPIVDLTDGHHYNEVFFDSVRVPKKYLLGQKNNGWYQVTPQLDYERSGLERLMTNYPLFQSLIKYVKETAIDGIPLARDTVVRQELARLKVHFEAGRLLIYRVAWLLDQGKLPNYETAMAKDHCTLWEKSLARVALDVLGQLGQLRADSKWTPIRGMAAESYLFSPSYTLGGGTTEVLKNIIAVRGLELPNR